MKLRSIEINYFKHSSSNISNAFSSLEEKALLICYEKVSNFVVN